MMTLKLRGLGMLVAFVTLNDAAGADTQRMKVIDPFHSLDEKTLKCADVKLKVVLTGDGAHPKCLEITADFANPLSGGWVVKSFAPGLVNPKKYSGIRMWVRSETETGFGVGLGGDRPRSDGSPMAYGSFVKATPAWTEVVIPFSACVKAGVTIWKDGAQKVFAGGGPIFDEDYPRLTSIGFTFLLDHRGNSTVGKVQVEGLGLVEK